MQGYASFFRIDEVLPSVRVYFCGVRRFPLELFGVDELILVVHAFFYVVTFMKVHKIEVMIDFIILQHALPSEGRMYFWTVNTFSDKNNKVSKMI